MISSPLEVSPAAEFLLSLANSEASGQVEIGGRRVALSKGEVLAVYPAKGDAQLGEFLLKSGALSESDLALAQKEAEAARLALDTILSRSGLISENDLMSARRSLWLDRLVGALRATRDEESEIPTLERGEPSRSGASPVRLAPLVLDALARCATEGDAEAVGTRLNYRLSWVEGPLTDLARQWAGMSAFADQQPPVSAILLKMPAAAPVIAALVRSRMARLLKPGDQSSPPRPVKITLPSPGPQLSAPPLPKTPSLPPSSCERRIPSLRPPEPETKPQSEADATRDSKTAITRIILPVFTLNASPFDDPIAELEDRIALLEESKAPGTERASAWCELGREWSTRIGSIEEAARAYREAAACDPSCKEALEQSAHLCRALGDAENAGAYAEALAASAPTGAERAQDLRFIASLARLAGDLDKCTEKLCEAAAEDETNPEPHEQVVRLLVEMGNLEGAVTHARLTAKIWQEEQPERARAMLAWAFALRRDDPELAVEYADLLKATGRPEAAIAVMAQAAGRTNDWDIRRRLILNAAQLAEEIRRTDLAVELILEAFDSEPHVDIYYEPLFEDLADCGTKADLAVIAEEIAAVCAKEQKSYWLRRASEATWQLPGRGEDALLLLVKAVEADPSWAVPLDTLRQLATSGRDRSLLAYALQRAAEARMADDPQGSRALFEESAVLAEEQLGAVNQALDAWKKIASMFPDDLEVQRNISRLSGKVRIHQGLLEAAERALNAVQPADRHKLLRNVAVLLWDRPEDRRRAADLYREYLAVHTEDEAAASALEWLISAMGEGRKLVEFLQSRIDLTSRNDEKERLLSRLAAEKARLGDYRGATQTCFEILSVQPQHPEAMARLSRAAARVSDPAVLRKMLRLRAQVAANAHQRGRALCRQAALYESMNKLDAALAVAEAALAEDPSAADAALLILRQAEQLPPEKAITSLNLARSVLGDSQPVLATLVRSAVASNDQANYLRALEAWHRLAPLDPEPALALLALTVQKGDVRAIVQSAETALNRDLLAPGTGPALYAAASRLDALGEPEQAARLALQALDMLGDPALLSLALDLAGRSGRYELITSALERKAAWGTEEERVDALRELARRHQRQGKALAESRAHLRLLGIVTRDIQALDRLASLYAGGGDKKRLLVVLSLMLDATGDLEQRRNRLFNLACAFARFAQDLKGAEDCITSLILGYSLDEQWLRKALGALFAIGGESWACEAGLRIASLTSGEPGGRICELLVTAAEKELGNRTLALGTAARATELFPSNQMLLSTLERIALSQGDVDTVLGVYLRLADKAMGPHGRRAYYYRAARWLERAGKPQPALEHYLRSFAISPGSGAAFKAIERLAPQLGMRTSLIQTYQSLAERSPEMSLKAELLLKAGMLCLEQPGDAERGFKLLLESLQIKGGEAVEQQVYRAVELLQATDPAAAEAARAALAEVEEQMRAKPGVEGPL